MGYIRLNKYFWSSAGQYLVRVLLFFYFFFFLQSSHVQITKFLILWGTICISRVRVFLTLSLSYHTTDINYASFYLHENPLVNFLYFWKRKKVSRMESDKIREGKRIIVRNNDACVPENGLDVFHFVARCWIVISSSCFTSLSYRVSVKGCFFGSIRCSVSRGNVEWNERYFVCRV